VTATAPLRQGGEHAAHKLGVGSSTFGGAGCLLYCLDNARHRLTGHPLDPVGLNDLGVANDAFIGSGAKTEQLANLAGLSCGPRVEQSVEIMSKMLAGYLATKRLALLHVDHDSTKPKGDPEADHWVLAHTQAGLTVVYDDPATGEMGGLILSTLTAPSAWRDHRPYVVRAFRTLSKI
jgi:hypothetical protein